MRGFSGVALTSRSVRGRALGAWRRSLQLRVVTSDARAVAGRHPGARLRADQPDHRPHPRGKVRAATEEIERARNTVSGIVGGEETRSLDSSLQLARNTLIDRKADAGAGLAGAFDAVLVVPGDGPRAATAARPGRSRSPTRCATSSRPARSATSTRRCTPTASPARADHRQPDVVAGHESRAVPDLPAEQRGSAPSRWCAARWSPAAWCCSSCWPPSRCWWRARSCCRCGRRRGSPSGSPKGHLDRAHAGARRGRHGAAGGVVQRHGREPASARSPSSRSSATCSAGSPPTSATSCAPR